MSLLYHEDIYIPEEYISQVLNHQKTLRKIHISRHLREHINNPDYKHDIESTKLLQCLKRVINNPVSPFEVEIDNRTVIKYVIRTSYDSDRDVSIAILVKDYCGIPMIKTAWLNKKSDKHYTLDVSKYVGRQP